MTGHRETLRWFPLVARPRPACPPLPDRIRDIADTARLAQATPDPSNALRLAAVAHNKAALIASDCGIADLARSLCLQQHQLYQRAEPLPDASARNALEPIINVARLLIRDGKPLAGYALLHDLLTAAKTRGTLSASGCPIDLSTLVCNDSQAEIVQWLWTVLLADGSRALTAAGNWSQALAMAEQHSGIGERLLDGRQVAIMAKAVNGDTDGARAVLEAGHCTEAWEEAVHMLLDVVCQGPDALGLDQAAFAGRLPIGAEYSVFRTRAILIAIDLHDGSADGLYDLLSTELTTNQDGYASRDVLAHRSHACLTKSQQARLTATAKCAGLGQGHIPAAQLRRLLDAVHLSESVTTDRLGFPPLVTAGWAKEPAL